MVLPANALFAGTLAWSCSTKVAAVETIFFRKKSRSYLYTAFCSRMIAVARSSETVAW